MDNSPSRSAGPNPATPDLRRAVLASAVFVLLVWGVWTVDVVLGLELGRLGVYPRDAGGLVGILFAPVVHGSALHLAANTPSLLVLGTAMNYGYPRSARIALPGIWLGSGLGVWLFARESYHIGASGLTHGLMFFIFVIGILRRDRLAIALSLVVFFLYGGMIWNILPQDPRVSFESHFFGAAAGLVLAVALRNRDPKPPQKRYAWEDEPDDEDDPPFGNPSPGPSGTDTAH
jgi:membrane associated rhomboid family serine protease